VTVNLGMGHVYFRFLSWWSKMNLSSVSKNVPKAIIAMTNWKSVHVITSPAP